MGRPAAAARRLVLLLALAAGAHAGAGATPAGRPPKGGEPPPAAPKAAPAPPPAPLQQLRGAGVARALGSSTAAPSSAAAANTTRYTWNGCACLTKWAFEDDDCSTACCNPDEDSTGEWCMVADAKCEEVDWGYCRPATASNEQCTDDPPGWKDAEEDTCGDYISEEWCTTDGGYGSGWQNDWGKFENYSHLGKNATGACCWCGGGKKATTCTDLPAWEDVDGDTCAEYSHSAWCTSSGGFGAGWHEQEWGSFQDFADGFSATQACCACGGGRSSASGGGSAGDSRSAPPVPRTTWNGCKCKNGWTDASSQKICNSYCCNTDEDPAGEWCQIEDESCEEQDWGYCRPAGTEAGNCLDSDRGWVDAYGYSCTDYVNRKWCIGTTTYGDGWEESWGTFEEYSNHGKNAHQVCCACGGGTSAASNASAGNCTDVAGWKDNDDDTCEEYVAGAWCTPLGVGPGWHEEWGVFADFGTVSATTACCGCGGGTRSGSAATSGSPAAASRPAVASPATPAPSSGAKITWNACACKKTWADTEDTKCDNYCCNPDDDPNGAWCLVEDPKCEDESWGYCVASSGSSAAACRNDPPGWKDSEGDNCDTYEVEEWCTMRGTYGDNWDEEEWGDFASFKSEGKDASTACCACGGGNGSHTAVAGAAVANGAPGCTDEPHWRDPDDDECADYADYAWCNITGGFGLGWHEEWGGFPSTPGGKAAPEACCACGRGTAPAALPGPEPVLGAAKADVAVAAAGAVPGVGGPLKLMVLLAVAVVAGLLGGWYCYRSKVATGEGIKLGVGSTPYGRKYQTVEDEGLVK